MIPPAVPVTPEIARRLAGRPLLLLLDVDGTLAPIAGRPQDAVVSDAMRRLLDRLAAIPGVEVAAVSGRAADDARRLIGTGAAWVIGNHGVELARPGQRPEPHPDAVRYVERVQHAAKDAAALAARDDGIVVEDKRWSLSVHYRLADPSIVPALRAAVEAIARALGLRLTEGKQVLELRPPVDIDKGTAVVDLARRLGALASSASVLCAGDDRTDEDAFRAMRRVKPDAVTIRVGHAHDQPTAAEFRVDDPDMLRQLLEWVNASASRSS